MAEHKFIQHLKEDHVKQKKLGKQMKDAKGREDREQLRQKLYASLYPHMKGEEASFFFRLKTVDDEKVRLDALEGLEEHHVTKLVLKEIMKMKVDTDVFIAKAKVLDELNNHHIEEEEEDTLAHLVKLCSDQELSDLFQKYEQAEEETKKEKGIG